MKLISHDLVCMKCGNVYTVQFADTIIKRIYSSKQMWCFKCKEMTNQVNIIDYDAWKVKMASLEEKTELEKYLLKLTEKNEENRIYKKIL